MIGLPELLVLALIIVIIFGGYKKLPQLGRSAGRGLRIGGQKAKELAAKAEDRAGDKFDAASVGRKAGEGVREARELRDSFKGTLDAPPAKQPEEQASPPAQPSAPTPPAAPRQPEPAAQPATQPDEEGSRRADSNR